MLPRPLLLLNQHQSTWPAKISSRYYLSQFCLLILTVSQQLAQQQQQQQAAQNPLGGAGRGGLGGGNLQQLMNSPQAAQLRQLVQTNPAMLQTLIQSLAASDPALAQTLAQNPEMLMQMLAGENMGGEGDDGEGNPIPPGATVIELTPAEREAVQRVRRQCLIVWVSDVDWQW
jgi:hypothetical protein